MVLTAEQLLNEARLTTAEISAAEAHEQLEAAAIDILLDVRDATEWSNEGIAGAVHAPRGTLEWQADPRYPNHNPALAGRTDAHIVVFCASGGRSLLAAKTLREMGYEDARSMAGGLIAWKAAGLPIRTRTTQAH